MAGTHDSQDAVVVTGDVSIDWNLARTRRLEGGGAAWNAGDCRRAYWQQGGAALLADLIHAVARELRRGGQSNCEVRQPDALQDGSFQQGQITHPIGRSIFVFAGRTSSSTETFGQKLGREKFRPAKGTDFISRLKGYVNILGPERPKPADDALPAPDPYYIIRRGILLRWALQRNAPQLLQRKEGKQIRVP